MTDIGTPPTPPQQYPQQAPTNSVEIFEQIIWPSYAPTLDYYGLTQQQRTDLFWALLPEWDAYFSQSNSRDVAGFGQYLDTLPDNPFSSMVLTGALPGAPESGPEDPSQEQQAALSIIQSQLDSWGLGGLTNFVWGLITQGFDPREQMDFFISQIRGTELYQTVFPEMAALREKGLLEVGGQPVSEAAILHYREEARRLARELTGSNITNSQISGWITNGKSLAEVETDLRVFRLAQDSPDVKAFLEAELGSPISDQDFNNFLHPERATPELQDTYSTAIERGYARAAGFEVSPEMVDALRALGLTVNFEGGQVQGLFGQGGVIDRYNSGKLALADTQKLFGLEGTALEGADDLIVRGLWLNDPKARLELANLSARAIARGAPQGGVASSGGLAVGALTKEQRRRRGINV